MYRKYLPTIITVSVLILALVATAIFLPWDRFAAPDDVNGLFKDDPQDAVYTAGLLLYGASKAPYAKGDVVFDSSFNGTFRYKHYGAEGTPEEISKGFDASSWKSIEKGQVISGTDCRNITVVSTDNKGIVLTYAKFDFVPGVIYGYSNPDQYDDPVFYNAKNPSLEDPRAVKLASSLFKTADTSYYGKDYGSIIQGFLTKQSSMAGILEGYYHTGTDFNTQEGRPFYSPISGKIINVDVFGGYNTIAIYCQEKNVTLLILHGQNVDAALNCFKADGNVEKGDLLGYGGSAGNPAGDTNLHVELRNGKCYGYKSFSKDAAYTRKTNYDPLVLADMFDLITPQTNEHEEFTLLGTSAFNAQNNCIAIQVGNWLYYIDRINGHNIFKARPDGSDVTLLSTDRAANLNYADGWLYYSDISEEGHLTKVSCSGGEPVKITEVDTSSYVLLVDDWIYFTNTLSKNNLFKIRLDGTEREAVLVRDISHLFYFERGFYYTQDARVNAERPHYFSIDTQKSTQAINVRADRPFVLEGLLCYRRYYSDKNCIGVPLGSSDENAAKQIIPNAYNHVQEGFRYLVFTNESDANSLYVKLHTQENAVKLSDDIVCSELTMAGGWLYYYTVTDQGNTLARINVEALEQQRLTAEGWVSVKLMHAPYLDLMLLANRTGSMYIEPTPTPEGMTPTPDGMTSTPDGVTPTPDGATPTPDGATPTPDGETPKPDGATPTPDGVTPTPDGVTPTPDGETPTPDGVTPTPDGVTPTPDGETPTPDEETPAPDGVTPTPDEETPTPSA